jgi:hypothetical protein
MQREYAATISGQAQKDAEQEQCMHGAKVALTMADLEDMHQGKGWYGQEGNLAQRCKNMLERVLNEFLNTTAPGGVRWSAHGDTKSALVRGGGQEAFAKLVSGRTTALVSWGNGQVGRTSGVVMILAIINGFRGKYCLVMSVECAREYACYSSKQPNAERRLSWFAGPADHLHATQ